LHFCCQGCRTPYIEHGDVHDEVTGNYSVMSVVEINCHSGYRFPHIKSTVMQVVCRADGTWTDLLGIEDVHACECEIALNYFNLF